MCMQKTFPYITSIFLIVVGFAGIITGQGVLTGGLNPAQEANMILANRIAGGLLVCIIGGLYFFFIIEDRRTNSFITFLENNRSQLLSGDTVLFEGVGINLKTEVIRYQTCVSFIVPWPWGLKLVSSYYATKQPGRLITAFLCSLITLLFGWIGVWTIIWLVSTLIINFTGGYRQVISEILGTPQEHTVDERVEIRLHLGYTPPPGEAILLDEKAVHRFGWFGVHLKCRVIITDKRLIFHDEDNTNDSFEMLVDDLRSATFKQRFGSDLVIRFKDGHKREIGLESGQWLRVMERIKEITETR